MMQYFEKMGFKMSFKAIICGADFYLYLVTPNNAMCCWTAVGIRERDEK